MLMGTTCPYCPSVLKALQSLLDSGHIDTLETYNIEEHPDIAQHYGVRSVPWVRIGEFELEGLRSEKELREWAVKAASGGYSTATGQV
jgi:thioredoxin-like negative regulator of GroEL